MGDYSRIEDHLSKIAPDIAYEYGDEFENLDKDTQRQVLLDHFFKGREQYRPSAEDMRLGILAYTDKPLTDSNITVSHITRRGYQYRVIRDGKTGRIKQWVRED